MPRWRREEDRDEIELAAGVPDAAAVVDDDGGLIGWDETAAHAYLEGSARIAANGTSTEKR